MQGRGSVKGCDLLEELESRGPQEGNGKGSSEYDCKALLSRRRAINMVGNTLSKSQQAA